MGVTISDDHDVGGYQTRLGESINQINFFTNPFDLAKKNLVELYKTMDNSLTRTIFSDNVIETTKIIRFLTDLKSLAMKLKVHEAVMIGHQNATLFVEKGQQLTDTVASIPDSPIKETCMPFLRKLEKHTIDIKEQDLDSLNLIRDFLSSHQCLYEGVELIIHIIGIAAIKISVESVVES